MLHNRTLLARVFQSMASAMSFLSRGRRELGRRFVPLDNAPALFREKPSPCCLFGGMSVEDAIEKAVSASKVNKDLVLMPKRPKFQPFRASGSGARGCRSQPSSRSQRSVQG